MSIFRRWSQSERWDGHTWEVKPVRGTDFSAPRTSHLVHYNMHNAPPFLFTNLDMKCELFWPLRWCKEVSRPGIKPTPQQWQSPILTPLSHRGTPFSFSLFSAEPEAYESSQVRGRTGAAAAGPPHSPSNVRSDLHLRPTPQPAAIQILNPLSRARAWTPVFKDTSWAHYCWATAGTSPFFFLFFF